MSGSSDYPAAIDAFALTSPSKLGTADSEGRVHSARHEDAGAAIVAIETELGTDPAGDSATVKARFEADETRLDAIEDDGWVGTDRLAADAVTGAKIADDAVGSEHIQASAVGTSELGDGAVTRAKLEASERAVVNLMSADQAGFDTGISLWQAFNANWSISRITSDFLVAPACVQAVTTATASGGGLLSNRTAGGRMPVTEGHTYTVTAWVKNTVGSRNLACSVQFFGSLTGTSQIGSTVTGTTVTNPATFSFVSLTFTVPTGVSITHAAILIGTTSNGSSGDTFLVDCLSFYEASGTSRLVAPGGGVIVNPWLGGKWDEDTGARRLKGWDNLNSRDQTIFFDTGAREMAAALDNSWTAASVLLSRVGSIVTLLVKGLDGAAASANSFVTIPSGFQPSTSQFAIGTMFRGQATAYQTATERIYINSSWGLQVVDYTNFVTGTSRFGATLLSWRTTDAFPSSMPGTASVAPPSS